MSPVWSRKQFDIGWRDLAFGVGHVFWPSRRPADGDVVGRGWIPASEVLVSLSVRTGLDLLFAALRLPPQTQVAMTAVTIPDVVRIISHHGLMPVPVAVDADRLEPVLADLEHAISAETRMILVAHLFGSRVDMAPVIRLARKYNLTVVEDCAQAFMGREYAGHPESDVCLFSFGPIKTATSLGGAVLRVRDPVLRERMLAVQNKYPVQSRWSYLARLAKYAVLSLLSTRPACGALVTGCRLLGVNYDRLFSGLAHSFPPSKFFDRIRQRPCVPLVRLLQRRLAMFDGRGAASLRRRTRRGRRLARQLPLSAMVLGTGNDWHTYWALPVRVSHRAAALRALREAGFDATGRSSLVVVPSPRHPSAHWRHLAPWLRNTIFLPNGANIPPKEFRRMEAVLTRALTGRPATTAQMETPPHVVC